jgi:DNA-binding response OmpR family regulator
MQALAVEDDRDLRRFLSTTLREEGYGTGEAESGDRALDRARDVSYGCIILDVVLPGRDGFHVATELRSRGVFTPGAHADREGRAGVARARLESGRLPHTLAELLARCTP